MLYAQKLLAGPINLPDMVKNRKRW